MGLLDCRSPIIETFSCGSCAVGKMLLTAPLPGALQKMDLRALREVTCGIQVCLPGRRRSYWQTFMGTVRAAEGWRCTRTSALPRGTLAPSGSLPAPALRRRKGPGRETMPGTATVVP